MKKEEMLKYNLSIISNIDKEISNNSKEKNNLIKKYKTRIMIHNIISKLDSNLFKSLLTLIVTILCIYNYGNTLVAVLLSLGIILLVDIIINVILKLLSPKKDYYDKLSNYSKERKSLLQRRNTYINLYRYTLDEEKAILNNVKSRINHINYYEYDKYINSEWINNDKYALNKLLEMKDKEYDLVRNIKNKLYYEINAEEKTEGLSQEQLKYIAESIEQY